VLWEETKNLCCFLHSFRRHTAATWDRQEGASAVGSGIESLECDLIFFFFLIFFQGERRFWVAGELFHSRPRWCRFFLACLHWVAAAMQGAEHDAVFTSAEEQEKWLADAMALVQHHAFYMHRALDANNIRDVLKFSAQMLSELRTSKLSPQKYYELCIPSSSFPSFLPWIQQF
jgi:hypothetical protein